MKMIAAITGLVLLMCRFPAAQRRAQQEIDEATGGERLPTFEDAPKLKYVWACVQETLRYRPILPLGECARRLSSNPNGSIIR
jgi:cytochrome P450